MEPARRKGRNMAHRRIENTNKMILTVIVKPNSKTEGIETINSDTIKVKVNAQPEKGKANERIIELLSKHYQVPKSNIAILKGHTARRKLIAIELNPSN